MALFKQPDNIVKRIEILNPDINKYNPQISTKKDVLDPLRDIPIAFGDNFITPVLVHKQWANFFRWQHEDLQHEPPEFRYYAISAAPTKTWAVPGGLSSYIRYIFIDGQLVEPLNSITIDQNNFYTASAFTGNWGWGRTLNKQLVTGAAAFSGGNFGNKGIMYGYNLYCTYLKAGDDFTLHPFYTAFGPKGKQPNNLYIPKNTDYDMLIMLLRYDNRVFKSGDPTIQLSYYRYPVVVDTSNVRRMVEPTRGNCHLELLTNESYGLNLPESKFVKADFYNVGEKISAQFDIVKTPIGEIMNIIDNESTTNRVAEIGGVIRYASINNTGIAITDDNIIGDISIEYPDAKTSPTQIIGTYNSAFYGSTDIIIGDDTTNVQKLNIRTAGTLEEATTILEKIYTKLQNTITLKFKGDRTLHQLSIYDRITLSTNVFSATLTIIEIRMQDDYTFDIVAEADSGDAVPEARLGSARPLIQISEDIFIKPNQNEPTLTDPEQQEPIIIPPIIPPAPPPDEIAPPPLTEVTIAGLEHPYNFVTQSYNTKWYLGSTLDETTIDPTYDSNGIRTRLLSNYPGNNVGAFYEMDYSLIFRPFNELPPVAIFAVCDIHESSSEYVNILTGRTNYSKRTRFHFPGYFNDLIKKVRRNDNTSTLWTELATDWTAYSPTTAIYGGNLDPIYQKSYETPDRVYQVGDVADVTRRFRTPHTFEENITGIARPEVPFWYLSRGMRRTVGPGVQYFRLHFTAFYGKDARSISRTEYIGSTSFWGDGRGLLPFDRGQAIAGMSNRSIPVSLTEWTTRYPTTVAPPARNLS